KPTGCSRAGAGPAGAACTRTRGALGWVAPAGADALVWAAVGRQSVSIKPEASAAIATRRTAEVFISLSLARRRSRSAPEKRSPDATVRQPPGRTAEIELHSPAGRGRKFIYPPVSGWPG